MWMRGYSKTTFTLFELDLYEWLVLNSPGVLLPRALQREGRKILRQAWSSGRHLAVGFPEGLLSASIPGPVSSLVPRPQAGMRALVHCRAQCDLEG